MMNATSTTTVTAGWTHHRSVRSVRAEICARPGAVVPAVMKTSSPLCDEVVGRALRAAAWLAAVGLVAADPLVVSTMPQGRIVGCVGDHNDFQRRGRARGRRRAGRAEVLGVDVQPLQVVDQAL